MNRLAKGNTVRPRVGRKRVLCNQRRVKASLTSRRLVLSALFGKDGVYGCAGLCTRPFKRIGMLTLPPPVVWPMTYRKHPFLAVVAIQMLIYTPQQAAISIKCSRCRLLMLVHLCASAAAVFLHSLFALALNGFWRLSIPFGVLVLFFRR